MIRITPGSTIVEYFDTLPEPMTLPGNIMDELRAVYGETVQMRHLQNHIQQNGYDCGPLMIENLVHRAAQLRENPEIPLRFTGASGAEVRRHHNALPYENTFGRLREPTLDQFNPSMFVRVGFLLLMLLEHKQWFNTKDRSDFLP